MKKINIITLVKNILVLIFGASFVLVPLWMLVINSFKTLGEAKELSLTLPTKWVGLENYILVLTEGRMARGFVNTLLITVVTITLVIIISSLAAWVLARSRSRVFPVLYYVIISGIMIPPAVITTIRVLKFLNIYGSLFGLVLFYLGAILPFTIFYMTGFVKNIPMEIEEAARIDGASTFGVFGRIILPLMRPIIASSVIIFTLNTWNDFLYPFYFVNDTDNYTMTLGLYNFIAGAYKDINWHLLFAAIIVISAPLVILFFILQKQILKGITAGSIKG